MGSCGEPTRLDLDRRGLFRQPGPRRLGRRLRYGGHERELKGGEPFTTNNRMELTAAIEALESLNRACEVSLHTDFSIRAAASRVRWTAGRPTAGGRRPESGEERGSLASPDSAAGRHKIEWFWVKGHSDDELNARADKLARQGMAPYVDGAPAEFRPAPSRLSPMAM